MKKMVWCLLILSGPVLANESGDLLNDVVMDVHDLQAGGLALHLTAVETPKMVADVLVQADNAVMAHHWQQPAQWPLPAAMRHMGSGQLLF